MINIINLEEEIKKNREFLKKFVEKHNLKGIKIKELNAKEKDELAKSLV